MKAGVEEPFRVAIPARYGSSRLPGKPLKLLAGLPLIEHVHRRALASGASEVVIATDDERVRRACLSFGADVCLTSAEHATGTDRLAEVAERRRWPDQAIVVNLQGDEPLMPPALLRQVANALAAHPDAGISTLCIPIEDKADLFAPHVVKVVTDKAGYALYFSRAPIPFHRADFATGEVLPERTPYFHHLGLYAYRVEVLRAFPYLSPGAPELAEALEQLRALWHGIRIHVQQAAEIPAYGGVDTAQDLARVEKLLARAAD